MMNTWFPYLASLIILLFPYVGKFRYSLPALQSTTISLGVLGTFIGIAYSLMHFDPTHITENLPVLLNGLKTAVITVIAGISVSLLLHLFPGVYGIRKEKISVSSTPQETSVPVMQEILNQLVNLNENLPKAGIALNPDGSIRTGELFQDKALYDLAQQTSEIMHKQSHYLSITQEENRQLYEQLKQLLEATQATNKNLEMLVEKSIIKGNQKITAQVDELSQLVKHTGQHVSSQIQEMQDKRDREMQEFARFTATIASIIKKLNQTHNALYHPETEEEEKN